MTKDISVDEYITDFQDNHRFLSLESAVDDIINASRELIIENTTVSDNTLDEFIDNMSDEELSDIISDLEDEDDYGEEVDIVDLEDEEMFSYIDEDDM